MLLDKTLIYQLHHLFST